jgi:hypothetical protein|tara:strand:+ start:369 stop:641 length:273 start_codon:yes stop_codon:yes gene_type:complete
MKVGTEVIYYSQKQRKQYSNLTELWTKKAEIGKVEEVLQGSVRVNGEEVPKMYVRIARQVSWYAFWRARGFNRNLYWYLAVVIFFIVFIR